MWGKKRKKENGEGRRRESGGREEGGRKAVRRRRRGRSFAVFTEKHEIELQNECDKRWKGSVPAATAERASRRGGKRV